MSSEKARAAIGQEHGGQQNQQYPQLMNGQMVQVVHHRGPIVYQNYRSKQSQVLGVVLIIAGVLCIIFNAVAMGFLSGSSVIAYGIWGGVIFIITGSFGTSTAKYATKCKIITFLVLCIISACISAAVVILGALSAAIDYYYGEIHCNSGNNGYYYSRNSYNGRSSDSHCLTFFNVQVAMNSLIAILGLIGGIAAIWGSVICCKVWCCCRNYNENYMTTSGNQLVIVIPQQQGLGVPVQQQHAYTGQVNAAYPHGYQPQPLMNNSATPYDMKQHDDPNMKL